MAEHWYGAPAYAHVRTGLRKGTERKAPKGPISSAAPAESSQRSRSSGAACPSGIAERAEPASRMPLRWRAHAHVSAITLRGRGSPPTSAPGLGLTSATSVPGLGSPPATSALGLDGSLHGSDQRRDATLAICGAEVIVVDRPLAANPTELHAARTARHLVAACNARARRAWIASCRLPTRPATDQVGLGYGRLAWLGLAWLGLAATTTDTPSFFSIGMRHLHATNQPENHTKRNETK